MTQFSYSLTRAASWNLVGYLYLIVASLLSTPILLRGLGSSQFGIYSLIVATTSLLAAFDFGLPQAVIRQLTLTTNRDRIKVWGSSSFLFSLAGLLGASVGVGLLIPLKLGFLATALVGGNILLSAILAHYTTLPQSQGNFGYVNLKTFIVGTANTLGAAYLSNLYPATLTPVVFGQLLSTLLTLCILAIYSCTHFGHPLSYFPDLPTCRSLLSFGLKNQLGKIANQIQAQYAKYLLLPLGGSAVASYTIATGLIQKLLGGITQLTTALYPAATRQDLKAVYPRLQFALFGLSLLTLFLYHQFGESLIGWWLGNPQVAATVHQLLRPLLYVLLLLVLTPLPSMLLDARGRPELTSLSAVVTTGIEIGVSLFLFPRFGIMAPVYGSLVALALTTPILLLVTARSLAAPR